MTFATFENARVTVTRSEGTHGPDGFTETSTSTLLQARCDIQERTSTIDRLQSRYDQTLTAMVYVSGTLGGVQPGDDVSVDTDDGRTVTGSVVEVKPLDNAILI